MEDASPPAVCCEAGINERRGCAVPDDSRSQEVDCGHLFHCFCAEQGAADDCAEADELRFARRSAPVRAAAFARVIRVAAPPTADCGATGARWMHANSPQPLHCAARRYVKRRACDRDGRRRHAVYTRIWAVWTRRRRLGRACAGRECTRNNSSCYGTLKLAFHSCAWAGDKRCDGARAAVGCDKRAECSVAIARNACYNCCDNQLACPRCHECCDCCCVGIARAYSFPFSKSSGFGVVGPFFAHSLTYVGPRAVCILSRHVSACAARVVFVQCVAQLHEPCSETHLSELQFYPTAGCDHTRWSRIGDCDRADQIQSDRLRRLHAEPRAPARCSRQNGRPCRLACAIWRFYSLYLRRSVQCNKPWSHAPHAVEDLHWGAAQAVAVTRAPVHGLPQPRRRAGCAAPVAAAWPHYRYRPEHADSQQRVVRQWHMKVPFAPHTGWSRSAVETAPRLTSAGWPSRSRERYPAAFPAHCRLDPAPEDGSGDIVGAGVRVVLGPGQRVRAGDVAHTGRAQVHIWGAIEPRARSPFWQTKSCTAACFALLLQANVHARPRPAEARCLKPLVAHRAAPRPRTARNACWKWSHHWDTPRGLGSRADEPEPRERLDDARLQNCAWRTNARKAAPFLQDGECLPRRRRRHALCSLPSRWMARLRVIASSLVAAVAVAVAVACARGGRVASA